VALLAITVVTSSTVTPSGRRSIAIPLPASTGASPRIVVPGPQHFDRRPHFIDQGVAVATFLRFSTPGRTPPVIGVPESQWDFGSVPWSAHSPTIGLVRAFGIPERRELSNRVA
jgi:hypothetical protein